MARYWVYLNDQVGGPYELDQLIKLRGFSRRTLICVDDYSGAPGKWISPSEIPELAPIFKAVDQVFDPMASPAPPKAVPRPARPRMPTRLTPVAPPPAADSHAGWMWLLLFALLAAGGAYHWNQINQQREGAQERGAAQALIETYPLPAGSLYATLRQYLQSKQISPRWEFERTPTGIYNVTLSWLPNGAEVTRVVSVYAFEVNLPVQSVRGLNSAAIQLLTQGFLPPAAPTPPHKAEPPKKSMADSFPGTLDERRAAFEEGDFSKVWNFFSQRKRLEMEGAGISESGFVRLQSLTHRLDAGIQQTILKTKKDSSEEMLVLLRQSQPQHPDMYLKQTWRVENGEWKLDDEEKKMAPTPTPPPAPETPGNSVPPAAASASPAPALPGMSPTH